MISERIRALLPRYTLASRATGTLAGERLAHEAGQSLEFFDVRPYGPGDEPRYVDWNAYRRTGRLYTRLYQAERTAAVHILLDTSASMALGGKLEAARRVAQLLVYAAQGARTQVHLSSGVQSPPAHTGVQRQALARWVDAAAPEKPGAAPDVAIADFARRAPRAPGAGLALVISDLFSETPLRTSFAALRARGFDASFLHLVARADLEPEPGLLELLDAEGDARLEVGPAEVRLYREAVRGFVARTREAVLGAGFRYLLLIEDPTVEDAGARERALFAALVRAGVLVRR
jgi:uncharacterized protein (DUF58 family)